MHQDRFDEAMLRVAIHYHRNGRLAEAEKIYRQKLADEPKNAEVLHLLGGLCMQLGRSDEAIKLIKKVIAIRPKDAHAHFNLGNFYRERKQLDQTIACFRQALALNPRFYEALMNLGSVLQTAGEIGEAIACFREAIRLQPDDARAYGNLAYAVHFQEGVNASAILEEHREWSRRFAEPLKKSWQPHENDGNPDRRLRIGYVSPDLREHVVGRFMAPLLGGHDRGRFEIYCYASVVRPDAMTQHLRECTDRWHFVPGLNDEQLAKKIREDRIDILVDLTMHLEGGRLLMFARKPAPVQVTYLAYCSTTGLEAMDYRISDPYLDPPGASTEGYTEQTVRLPETYWCYEQIYDLPIPGVPPSQRDAGATGGGKVTLGCLNNFSKASDGALRTWGRIMQALPESRLVLHAAAESSRHRVVRLFKEMNVAARRVDVVGTLSALEYFRQYRDIDIALDPFPYAGGTTTCDALWMGVPVVTLAGKTAVGRGGVSILNNVGVPELAAQNEDDYVVIAAKLARDLPRLRELRATLRGRLQQSPLMNGPRFARHMEATYREMWRNWCAKGPGQ